MDIYKIDFEQARAKHLLFKARLRSLLYGIEVDNAPVVSQFECSVGKWIYSYALKAYSDMPEMIELEKVHARIHIIAKNLVELYHQGKVEDSRKGLLEMELFADELVDLLHSLEHKLTEAESSEKSESVNPFLNIEPDEFHELLTTNIELDTRIKLQVQQTTIANERFELISKATHDAVWDWDLINNLIWWNDGYYKLFNYDKSKVKPGVESWYDNIHPDDSDRVIEKIHQILDAGFERWEDEYRYLKGDGTYATVYDRGYALHDEHGKPYRMVGSMIDITAKKHLEEERQQATLRLLKQKDEFLSIASHELKTPLTSMKVYIQLLNRMTVKDENKTIHSFVEKAEKQVNKLSILVSDLLDVTKIQSGKMVFTKSVFNIYDIVLECSDQFQQSYTHQIEIVGEKDTVVTADQHRIEQVINNIFSNAIKYSPAADKVVVSVDKQVNEVRISIRDFGIGVPPQDQKDIFNRFFRVDTSENSFSGLGLGLYISAEIIRQHQGEIGVISEDKSGSTFWFTLPL